jgi:insertion element IS1 protein InsB
VNQPLLNTLHSDEVDVVIQRADEAEVDEMWSFVGKKTAQRWLWHAIDHHTGKVLAYVFGRRQDQVFLQLQGLLEPFGITRYDTDYWGAYTRHLDPDEHNPGKRNTQQIERKHLTLRTRIKRLTRKTICFSRSIQMHDIVIGLFVNRYEFGWCPCNGYKPIFAAGYGSKQRLLCIQKGNVPDIGTLPWKMYGNPCVFLGVARVCRKHAICLCGASLSTS